MEPAADPLKVLILDAGAFITQAKFDHFGPEVKYVTLSAVVQHELKDENARQVHSNFPFPIETRIPSGEAIKAIVDFARKTGDLPSLSPVDIQVLALCYMYERERNGLKRIREEPPKRIVPPSEKKTAVTPVSSSTTASTTTSTTPLDATSDSAAVSLTGTDDQEAEEEQEEEGDEGEEEEEEGEQPMDGTAEPQSVPGNATTTPSTTATTTTTTPSTTTATTTPAAAIPENDPFWGKTDDGEGEWITASNIHLHKNRVKKNVPLADLSDVGCITTDFAMQNVMIAMGLRLLSVRGLAITTIRTHVRRCHACWAVELNMEKDNNFCRVCGGHTLMKAVFHINANGVPRYYMSQKAINNKRGTVYSIPKFKGGRHNKDLILREDAMKSTKLHAHKKKAETPFEDSIEFGYGKVGSKVSAQHATEQFGYGRRNPNVVQVGKRDKNKRNHRRK